MSILRFYAHYSGIYKIVTLKITAWKHVDQHVPISGFQYISYDIFFGFQSKIIAFIVHLDIVEVNRPNNLFPRLKKWLYCFIWFVASKSHETKYHKRIKANESTFHAIGLRIILMINILLSLLSKVISFALKTCDILLVAENKISSWTSTHQALAEYLFSVIRHT